MKEDEIPGMRLIKLAEDMAKYKPETAGFDEAFIRAFVTKLAEGMAKYKLETAGLDKVFSEAFVTALSEGKLKQHLLSEEGKFHH